MIRISNVFSNQVVFGTNSRTRANMRSETVEKKVAIKSPSYVVNAFSLLAVAALLLFGAMHVIIEHQIALGVAEIIGGSIFALNALFLRITGNVDFARDFFLLLVLAFLILMLMTGGTERTGAFWFFTYPVGTYFLAGKRVGTYWMIALLVVTVAVLLLVESNIVTIAYSFVEVRQLLVTLGVVAGGMYAYQQARESVEWQLREEQLSVDRAKAEFLALASHQLRTPVSAIKWFSEMLLNGDAGKLSEEQRDYIAQVYSSNQRSAVIIDAIITISNLRAGTMSTRFEMVDIAKLCHRSLQIQTADLPIANKLHIEERYDPAVPKVSCDLNIMQTVIQNLLSNAIKYTPAGGTIKIGVMLSDEKITSESKGSVAISIEDTGYGIPKRQQGKIFTQLFRATNIKAKDTDGTGLGLYIVKALLDRLGGRVTFKSKEEVGSIFTVLLPLEGMLNQDRIGEKGNL